VLAGVDRAHAIGRRPSTTLIEEGESVDDEQPVVFIVVCDVLVADAAGKAMHDASTQ
jgi:hypothetical protein